LDNENTIDETNDDMVDDIEDAIERSGGCSKYQSIAFTYIVFGMVAGAFVLYSISYFELTPDYNCYTDIDEPSTYVNCTS